MPLDPTTRRGSRKCEALRKDVRLRISTSELDGTVMLSRAWTFSPPCTRGSELSGTICPWIRTTMLMAQLKDWRTVRLIGKSFRLAQFELIYEKHKRNTMIPRDQYVNNLLVATKMQSVPGCVVECGTWRGGMSAGMADLLGPARHYYLFDSFEGLPPAGSLDGELAKDWQGRDATQTYNNCTASEQEARAAMCRSRAEHYELIRGWFSDTVPSFQPEPIALLRLDGDWYDSTMIPLKHLYPWVVSGGIVIIDDYHVWDGCTRAVNEFVAGQQEPLRIREFSNHVCYIVKP
jgi:O-methyltransferase